MVSRFNYREEKKHSKNTTEWHTCFAEKSPHYYYCQDLHHVTAYNKKWKKVRITQDFSYLICNTDICIALRSARSAGRGHPLIKN